MSSSEAQGNGLSGGPVSVSASGRYVAFRSAATNLVPGDTNGVTDVFVRDMKLGTTVRADVSTSGVQANAAATNAIMSGNGRYVFFLSLATNLAPVPEACTDFASLFRRDLVAHKTIILKWFCGVIDFRSVSDNGRYVYTDVPGGGCVGAIGRTDVETGNWVGDDGSDTHCVWGGAMSRGGHFMIYNLDAYTPPAQVYVRRFSTGATRLVSVRDHTHVKGNKPSVSVAVAGHGRYSLFDSKATNLVPGDTNGKMDVFVHNAATNHTARVSIASTGRQANRGSRAIGISTNGRFVLFWSKATNLVPRHADTNNRADLFIRDRLRHTTRRVNLTAGGRQSTGRLYEAPPWMQPDQLLSADGRWVAFTTDAPLVPGDTNRVRDVFMRGPLH